MAFELGNTHDWMTSVDILGDEVPDALKGRGSFETAFLRDRDFSRKLADGAMPSSLFLYLLAKNAHVLADGPSLLCFGGGHVPEVEKKHAFDTSARSAYLLSRDGARVRPVHVQNGSGPGTMKETHEGPKQLLRDGVLCVGTTLQGLAYREPPGSHNDNIVFLLDMARRLEFFLRSNHVGEIFPGGPGTIEEIAAVLAVLLYPENAGIYYPFLLSEPYMGNDTYMMRLKQFLDYALGGDLVREHFTFHQGKDRAAFSALMDIPPHRGDFWRWDLKMPEHAFTPFKLNFGNIERIDLTHGRDDPARFCAHLRWFMNLIVKLTMTNPEFLEQNGPPKVRVGRDIHAKLDPLLRGLLAEERIKSHAGSLEEIVRWHVV